MFVFQGTFTDVHGIEHTNPYFSIKNADQNTNNNVSVRLDESTNEMINSTSVNNNINYSACFWINEAAFTSGKTPLDFILNGERYFHLTPETSTSTAAELIALCEADLESKLSTA